MAPGAPKNHQVFLGMNILHIAVTDCFYSLWLFASIQPKTAAPGCHHELRRADPCRTCAVLAPGGCAKLTGLKAAKAESVLLMVLEPSQKCSMVGPGPTGKAKKTSPRVAKYVTSDGFFNLRSKLERTTGMKHLIAPKGTKKETKQRKKQQTLETP